MDSPRLQGCQCAQLRSDIPDPFASPLPRPPDARILRQRRLESLGPLDPYDDDDDDDDSDSDDGDADDEDEGDDDDDAPDRPTVPLCDVTASDRAWNAPIALPQLLHKDPLCYTIPALSEPESGASSPPTLISESESDIETQWDSQPLEKENPSSDDDDVDEAYELKTKRNAHRSRAKILAILGPEASSAL